MSLADMDELTPRQYEACVNYLNALAKARKKGA